MKNICVSLFLITVSKEEGEENIIFANFKEEDNEWDKEIKFLKTNSEIYRNNSSTFKQWFCIGRQKDLYKIYQEMKETNSKKNIIEIKKKNFKINAELIKKVEENKNSIKGISKSDSYLNETFRYENYDFLEKIYFDSFKDKFTENFNTDENKIMMGIYPYGYITSSQLQKYIDDQVILNYMSKFFYFNFHGDRTIKGLPNKFIGFIQATPIPRKNITVGIMDMNTNINTYVFTEKIDEKSGVFTIQLPTGLASGKIVFKDHTTDEIIAGEKFQLITDFKFNMQINEDLVIDLSDNEHSYSKNQLKKAKDLKIKAETWFLEDYNDPQKYIYSLTQKYTEIFSVTGPEIIIVDPYLFGDITDNERDFFKDGQKIFFNGLIKALTAYEYSSIKFLGSKKRITKKINENVVSRYSPERYSIFLRTLEKIQKNLKIAICISKESFHDRYIVSKGKKIRVFKITTSINGLMTSGEVSISELEIDEAKKVQARINRLVEEAVCGETISI